MTHWLRKKLRTTHRRQPKKGAFEIITFRNEEIVVAFFFPLKKKKSFVGGGITLLIHLRYHRRML